MERPQEIKQRLFEIEMAWGQDCIRYSMGLTDEAPKQEWAMLTKELYELTGEEHKFEMVIA